MNDAQDPRARHIVLIVDDDEIVLQVFRELLDGEGLRVVATRSARCALRFAERAIPHLVMSDVMMPEMSGLSLCHRFKANPRTAQVPVVLTSGQGQTVDVERGIAAGAVDYIKKPFDRDEVRFRVRAHLRSQDLKLQQQRAHDQLAAISRAARDAIMLTDSQQNITHWNEAASSLFGYSSAEALGRNVIQLIAPPQVHLAVDAVAAVCDEVSDLVGKTTEVVAVHKSGHTFPIELSLSRTAIDGQPYTVGMARDISERKRIETALQQSEERYRSTFENASIGQALATLDGHFANVNRAFATMLGYTEAELCGTTFAELTHPDDVAEALDVQRALLTGEVTVRRMQKRYIRKDGTSVWADVSVTALRDAAGNMVQFNTHAVDISERKRAQDEQARSETKFRTLYDASSDAVMLLDETGFFDCNQATVRMFGCHDKAQFYANHPSTLSPACQPCGTDSLTLANQRIATALDNGSHRFEWVHKRLDTGEAFPAEVLLSRMNLDGRQVLQATVRDISQRKLADAQLRDEIAQRQKIEVELSQSHKLEAVGHLAAGIAHEINSPSQWVSDNVMFLKKAFEALLPVIESARAVVAAIDTVEPDPEALARLHQTLKRIRVTT